MNMGGRPGRAPAALLAAAAALLGGCDYLLPAGIELGQHRVTVQQGNALEESAVRELRIGMTQKQVLFLLGSPTVRDPFHAERWDYPYYLENPEGGGASRLDRLSLEFEGDRVARISRLVPIDAEAAALEPDAELELGPGWFREGDVPAAPTRQPAADEPVAEPEQTRR